MDERRSRFMTRELDYELPPELIAQTPPARREDARMLVVDRASHSLRDCTILDLPGYLRAGDLLVVNDTKVVPAKFLARRRTGGAVEGLFVEEESAGLWRVLLEGSRRLRVGERLIAGNEGPELELVERLHEGQWRIRVGDDGSAEAILARIGRTPLPPYIRRDEANATADALDASRYQTVYARASGAVAAPTAGLHLTESLLGEIRRRGVQIAAVTLHVGLGTFKPVVVDDLADHVMHAERYEVSGAAFDAIAACRGHGGRVVAVGTTTVRVLESLAGPFSRAFCSPGAPAPAQQGSADLLIYPPYTFRVVDALLTNFHLPRSTLLALVMAFAGVELTRHAYGHAIRQRYRFYSYGDAMLIP